MKTLKKIIVLFLFFLFTNNVDANSISSINMDIYVDNNGTAHIKETWNTYLNEGTEGYKPYYNLGNSEIKNFKVSLNNQPFIYMPNWDTSASFEEKVNKNGINEIEDGVELCFGITRYGTNSYTMEYDITNFVSETEDAQIIYWTLIPHDLQPTPEKVYIKIYSDFKYEDTWGVWGYGNYGGEAYIYDGYIELKSPSDYSSDDYMTVLVKFPLNTFQTTNKIENDFDYYLDMAEEGATSYSDKESFLETLIYIFGAIAIVGGSIVIIALGSSKTKLHFEAGNKIKKDVPYIRDVPFKDNLMKAYWLAKQYNLMKKDTDFFGVMLLKWLKEKQIEIIKETTSGVFKSKEETNIKFKENVNFDNLLETKLYEMMLQAAVDGVLSKNEFKKWANKNYTKILNWFDDVIDKETKNYEDLGLITYQEVKTLGIFKTKVRMVSKEVNKEAELLYGVKKFLEEFSRIYEKEPIEVGLWEYYLIYGQLFGIADKVAKDFKHIYPDVITEDTYTDITFVNYFAYHAMIDTVNAKSRAESYNSGGGGFSSGGGGFGSFGGGGGGGGFR